MSRRTERVGATMREELASLFQRSMPEYLDGMITIVSVKVTADLSLAKVYVSIFRSKTEPSILIKRLNANQPELRTELAHRVRMKRIPELRFYLDDTLAEAERIEKLLQNVREEDEKRNAAYNTNPQNQDDESDDDREAGRI